MKQPRVSSHNSNACFSTRDVWEYQRSGYHVDVPVATHSTDVISVCTRLRISNVEGTDSRLDSINVDQIANLKNLPARIAFVGYFDKCCAFRRLWVNVTARRLYMIRIDAPSLENCVLVQILCFGPMDWNWR
ncbi:hypothetical protein J1614_003177 [Plenodomus biglobosus]|nr:hypothetical protein J1614_003177 [Plenodomus biglobosus]